MVAAPIDSAAVAGALAGAAASWLSTTFPGLDAATLDKLAALLGSLPVIAAIFLWETGGKLVGRWFPGLGLVLGPFWSKYKILLNPLLGLVFGTAGGNPLLGLIASGVWSVGGGAVKVMAGPSTAAGRARAGMGVVLLGALLLPSVASAATPYTVANFPFVWQGGVGAKIALQSNLSDQRTTPYLWAHMTFPVRNRWILRARLEQPLQRVPMKNRLGKMEARVEAGFSFP
jgi:hypothetical protein